MKPFNCIKGSSCSAVQEESFLHSSIVKFKKSFIFKVAIAKRTDPISWSQSFQAVYVQVGDSLLPPPEAAPCGCSRETKIFLL
jgi:hypothetical protein